MQNDLSQYSLAQVPDFTLESLNYEFNSIRFVGQFNHNFVRNRRTSECKVAESRRCLLLSSERVNYDRLASGARQRGPRDLLRAASVVWARVCDGALNREYPRDYLMCRSGRVCDIGSRFLSRTLAHASRRNVRCARIRDETIDRGDTIVAEERVRRDKIPSPYCPFRAVMHFSLKCPALCRKITDDALHYYLFLPKMQ